MSASDRSFSENLDLLIKLLRKLKNKSHFEGMPGVPKMFVTNFDFFLQNYERMKDQITAQLLQQFGEPIKQMVADMVDQLQDELDEELLSESEAPSEGPVITGHKRTVDEIDALLKNPSLSQEEIDKLLDERHQLKLRG
jgi:L-lactate utilization protein LutC